MKSLVWTSRDIEVSNPIRLLGDRLAYCWERCPRLLQAFLLTSLSIERYYVREVTIPLNACPSLKLYRLWLKVLVGRGGAASLTSLLNIGEGHRTSMRRWASSFFEAKRGSGRISGSPLRGLSFPPVSVHGDGRKRKGFYDAR